MTGARQLPDVVGRWRVDHVIATAADAHGRDLPVSGAPEVWVIEATNQAIALGSAQPLEVIDGEEAQRLGIEVVRRRSGGGAVLITPGDLVWIDVFVPRRDPLWDDDVARASHWLGAVWADTVARFGHDGVVHVGPMQTDALARLVCFAGVGPGEVVARSGSHGDRGPKLVGLSQRRTRAGARFQCAAHLRWNPEPLEALLADRLSVADRRRLTHAAAGVDAPAAHLVDAFLAELATR